MKLVKLLMLAVMAIGLSQVARADDNAYFKAGPLELNIPFKTGEVVYMYDFNASQNLVGGETPFVTLWNRVEGTFGAVTSLQGQGTPFIGGNILIGNVVDKWISLPADLKLGGFGGFDFHTSTAIYGLKASFRLWG